MSLIDIPNNHTVPLQWTMSKRLPFSDVLKKIGVEASMSCTVNHFIMGLQTDPHRMMPPLGQLTKSWVPWDTPIVENRRFHVIFSDVRQFRETLHYLGDDVVSFLEPDTPESDRGWTWLNLQYVPPGDATWLISSMSQTLTEQALDLVLLQNRCRRLENDVGALKELLGAHFPYMADDLGLQARPRAKARAAPPADDAP